mmetsp:Transcript_584/g.1031  ORF Transcript_584/g.1031 Transcript_584/m.1031 type:complete len:210 (-) Transcript_584:192-821(-)
MCWLKHSAAVRPGTRFATSDQKLGSRGSREAHALLSADTCWPVHSPFAPQASPLREPLGSITSSSAAALPAATAINATLDASGAVAKSDTSVLAVPVFFIFGATVPMPRSRAEGRPPFAAASTLSFDGRTDLFAPPFPFFKAALAAFVALAWLLRAARLAAASSFSASSHAFSAADSFGLAPFFADSSEPFATFLIELAAAVAAARGGR